MEQLNPQQLEAVEFIEGPILVFAGAGSGKTRVIVHRIVHLIQKAGIPPWSILAVTFTNKAANEMKSRIGEMLNHETAAKINMGTFHSICARIIRIEHEHLGLISSFTIADESQQISRIKQAFRTLNISPESLTPAACLERISRAKNRFINPQQMKASAGYDLPAKWTADIYEFYERKLKEDHALDFDDLIVKTVQLLEENPVICEKYQEKYKYVLIDEYQDTNLAQYRLISRLASRYCNLMVVGDDDQSIYGWRGADIRNIMEFSNQFPGAKIVKLEQNYRSTQNILTAANALMANVTERAPKKLWTQNPTGNPIKIALLSTELSEAEFIASEIQKMISSQEVNLNDIAVFYRINSQSRVLEENFLAKKLKYHVVGNIGFFKRKEVKDILAYIRLVLNPFDSAACQRIVNVPRRGIGQGTLEMLEKISLENGLDMFSAMEIAAQANHLTHHKQMAVKGFVDLIHELIRLRQDSSLSEFITKMLQLTSYAGQFQEENTPENQVSLEIVSEFENAAHEFEAQTHASLAEFADYLSLHDTPESNGREVPGQNPQSVALMTMHNAKGLEFPVVFLSGVVEGLCPFFRKSTELSDDELAEERRLMYVGITRAREQVIITSSFQRRIMGQIKPCEPSRFIEEIPEDIVQWLKKNSTESTGSIREVRLDPIGDYPEIRRPVNAIRTSTGFSKGDRVRHQQWGMGTIIDRTGAGSKEKITIHFDRYGVKKLIVAMTHLTRIN